MASPLFHPLCFSPFAVIHNVYSSYNVIPRTYNNFNRTPNMEAQLNGIEQLPVNQILREDDHRLRSSSYLQIRAHDFEFGSYDHGTKEMKEKYKIGKDLYRYFNKRNFLFSRFEQGIAIDVESWYSVIPEPVSLFLKDRFTKGKKIRKIFEPFCGVGGIAVHLCDSFDEYVVNDIDTSKINMLRHNLKVYGKSPQKVKYINQDFLQVEPFRTDAIIICPPWGGVQTDHYATHDLNAIMTPKLTDILIHAQKFSSEIMLQMPKQTNLGNLIRAIHQAGLRTIFTIDKVMTNGKLSQLFIYLGSETFTGINSSQLYNQLYRDLQKDKELKGEKRRLKEQLQVQGEAVLSQVYKSRYPNKIIYFD